MSIRNDILKHAALAFFGSAYADAADAAGQPLRGEIMDQLPECIDPMALRYSNSLIASTERANTCTIADLFAMVQGISDGDRECTPAMFGHYLAMQAMGHGVGLHDAFGSDVSDRVTVPHVEFGYDMLEREYF